MTELNIGDKAKEYIYTVMNECIGCIEIEVCQNLDGDKIALVTDSHGGVGYIMDGATGGLTDTAHTDDKCTVPDDRKYTGISDKCAKCWMK